MTIPNQTGWQTGMRLRWRPMVVPSAATSAATGSAAARLCMLVVGLLLLSLTSGAQETRMKPTHADVKYGPHARNTMDVWLPASDKPTPVVVFIHGGGFVNGSKDGSASEWTLEHCRDAGIAVVTINYRLSSQAIAPAPFLDAARAVQFIRHNAAQWNIDPTRIAASGGSAGGSLALWLAFHDDLADPKNEDPVLRQSTRLSCVVGFIAATTLDPRAIRQLIPECDTYKLHILPALFGIDIEKLDALPAEKYRLMEEMSPINHVTADDPPTLLIHWAGLDQAVTESMIGIHHARFGKLLKEKMDALKVPCTLSIRGDAENATFDFVKQQFLKK